MPEIEPSDWIKLTKLEKILIIRLTKFLLVKDFLVSNPASFFIIKILALGVLLNSIMPSHPMAWPVTIGGACSFALITSYIFKI